MFDSEFYPTPKAVIEYMFSTIDVSGCAVLEPHAGKGDIVDHAKLCGAHVLACELNEDLAKIAASKAHEFIGNDFFELKAEDISHVQFIIMNPPFSNADKHIQHAYNIAPDGCVILSLLNWETVNKSNYSRSRIKLLSLIEEYGLKENLGDVFSSAERKTGIDIGFIQLFKPKGKEDEFADYLFSDEEEPEFHESGLIQYSYIRDIVGRYIKGCQMFENVMLISNEINDTIKPLGGGFSLSFSAIEEREDRCSIDYKTYKKKLQKSAWRAIFREMKMEKYLTRSTLADVNKFVEQQANKPFSMKNISAMISVIVGTHGSRMNKVIEETFDWLTERHSDNRHSVEGWKTNSMYMVNKKFIAPYMGVGRHYNGGHPEVSWSSTGHQIDDLVKAICFITGKNYNNYKSIREFFEADVEINENYKNTIILAAKETGLSENTCRFWHSNFKHYKSNSDKDRLHRHLKMQWTTAYNEEEVNKMCEFYDNHNIPSSYFEKETTTYKEWGKWYEWTFFKIKVFKKGTFHCQFLDEKVWEMFNKAAVKAKGWQLPTRTGSDMNRKETGVEVY